MAFNKHEDGYAAVWKGKTEKAPTPGEGAGEAGEEVSVNRVASFPFPLGQFWWSGCLEASATRKPILLGSSRLQREAPACALSCRCAYRVFIIHEQC